MLVEHGVVAFQITSPVASMPWPERSTLPADVHCRHRILSFLVALITNGSTKRFARVPLGWAHAPIVCSVSAEFAERRRRGAAALELRGRCDAIVECIDGDPEIARWLDQVPQPYTRQDARGYIGGIGEQAFAITDRGDRPVLGSIGVRWNERRDVGEIGYWVRAEARGRGVITRALGLVSRVRVRARGSRAPAVARGRRQRRLAPRRREGRLLASRACSARRTGTSVSAGGRITRCTRCCRASWTSSRVSATGTAFAFDALSVPHDDRDAREHEHRTDRRSTR